MSEEKEKKEKKEKVKKVKEENSGSFWKLRGKKIFLDILAVLFSGILRAIGIFMFITPNHFAPGGTSGIAVLLEYATGWSSGIFLAIMSVPLFLIAFFCLGKREAVVSTASMLFSSGLLILFAPKYLPWAVNIQYTPDNGFLAAVAGGIVSGISLAIMLKNFGTSGGTTILASLVNKKYSNLSVSMLTSLMDATVVLVSFFVYNQGADFTTKLNPVLLACVALFSTSKVSDVIIQGFKRAYKFEIVTNDPDELAQEIMEKLHHGVTKINAEGMYTHEGKSVLLCIIRKRQVAELQRIVHKYPGAFAYFIPVSEVYGKFIK